MQSCLGGRRQPDCHIAEIVLLPSISGLAYRRRLKAMRLGISRDDWIDRVAGRQRAAGEVDIEPVVPR